jgi:hypothetical protein
MNDNGCASTTRHAAADPGAPSRPSTTRARDLCDLNFPPMRDASRSVTRKPTLCRFPSYSGPGLPSPTTSHGPAEPPPVPASDVIETAPQHS